MFIHYSNVNIHECGLLDALKSPIFMAYHDGQPFNKNMLRPCPMLENPNILREMVKRTDKVYGFAITGDGRIICVINANYMQSTGSLLQMNYGHLVGKETKMVITGIIILGITVYAVWAVRKV